MDDIFYIGIAAAVALFIAILSGLGVGSGGLFVIWLTSVYGVSAPQARGMNLLFFVFSATAALFFHYKKRCLKLKLIVILSFFALLGTIAGTFVSRFISPAVLRRIFGIFLVASGAYSFLSKGSKIDVKHSDKTDESSSP